MCLLSQCTRHAATPMPRTCLSSASHMTIKVRAPSRTAHLKARGVHCRVSISGNPNFYSYIHHAMLNLHFAGALGAAEGCW